MPRRSRKRSAPDHDRAALHRAGDAVAGLRREVRRPIRGPGRAPRPPPRWLRATGCSERDSRLAARRRASSAAKPGAGDEVGEGRAALGERSGLVEGDDPDRAQALERAAVAEQHAELRRPAGADHDRGRGREAHGAGAGDDEHRDGVDQGEAEARGLGPKASQPAKVAERRGDDGGHEPAGDPVDQGLDRQLGALRRLDHADDPREHGVGPDGVDRAGRSCHGC